MGTLNRAVQKIRDWFTQPRKNVGTGMPTSRTIPDPVTPSTVRNVADHRSAQMAKRRSKNRIRNKIAKASRRRNWV